MKTENDKLRNSIRTVQKNLQTLKDLFINAANNKKDSVDQEKIRNILSEIDQMDTVESDPSSESEEDWDDSEDE